MWRKLERGESGGTLEVVRFRSEATNLTVVFCFVESLALP